MEYLKDTENFGTDYKKDENLPRFFEKLISFIERRIFNKISKRVNFLLKRVNDQKVEIIADGNDDKDEENDWRLRESSGDLVIEKRVSGVWTEVEKYHG